MNLRKTLALALALALTGTAAAVPARISHQGRILDAAGTPVEGSHAITVKLWNASSGGAEVWGDTFSGVGFDNGHYQLVLGSGAPLDIDAVGGASALWVEIAIDSSPALTGRLPLTSVPFAFAAANATNVTGGVVDASEIRLNGEPISAPDGSIPWDAISGAPADADTLGALSCANGQVAVYNGSAWACAPLAPSAIDAAVITTGTLSTDRLPVGTGSGQLAAGDHTHDAAAIATGTLDAARIPSLDAAKIGSGTLDAARIPSLDASKITAGTLDVGRLPVGTASGTVAAGNHTHTAAQVGALPIGGGTLTGNLTVNGTLTANQGTFTTDIKVGSTTSCGSSADYGRIRFLSDRFEGCTSAGWVVLGAAVADINPPGTTLIPSSAFVDPNPPSGWTQCAGFINTAGDDVSANFMANCLPVRGNLRIRVWNASNTLEEDIYSTNLSNWDAWPNWNYLGGSATKATSTYWSGNTTFFTTTDGRDACGQQSAPSGATFGTGNGSTAIVAPGNTNAAEWRVSCGGQSLVDRKIAIYK